MQILPVTRVTLLLSLLLAPAVHAGDAFVSFRAPSDNIHCMIGVTEGATFAQCELVNLTPSYTRRPADCDLDWGHSFLIEARARQGEVACVGDTVRMPGAPVLDYGRRMERGGITCTSERSGMSCVNAAGHGFAISRGKQRVF